MCSVSKLLWLQAGLDWDKKSALAFFWSRRPTSTSNYIYIYSRRTCTGPENARYARLPVQPWLILILDVAVFRRLSTHSWVKHAQTHRAHKHFSLLSMSLFASLSAVFDLPIAGTFLLASCFFFLKEHLHFHITFAFYLVFLSLSFKFLSLINSIWFCTEIPEI